MGDKIQEIADDNLNKELLVCQNCPSKILRPGLATLTYTEFHMPVMRPKSEAEVSDTECLKEFWIVSDMYHFENIGFSRDVGNIKYLICADCEVGPIGYHNKETKLNYISLDRVKHVSEN